MAQRFTINMWFDSQAEDAAKFYTAIFKNARIGKIARYGKAGFEIHQRPEGSVMTVEFELDGQKFLGLNGGPIFKFNEAISLIVNCDGQEEVDYYWDRLTAGGDPAAQQCGWLKDRFGVSWQVVPRQMGEFLGGSDPQKSQRAFQAMMGMKKIDISGLKRAYDGK